jgi:hypothetical protein
VSNSKAFDHAYWTAYSSTYFGSNLEAYLLSFIYSKYSSYYVTIDSAFNLSIKITDV